MVTWRKALGASWEQRKKIDPQEKAGYVINDSDGMRYFEVDYNKVTDSI